MIRKKPDHYYHRAKREGYPARSVYKLEELNAKFRLLHGGDRVLDLGAAPGSWSKFILEKIGPKGILVGVDLEEVTEVSAPNARFLEEDLFEITPARLREHAPAFQAVLSDAAPGTTGNRDLDHARSVSLCERSLELACELLAENGRFVCKMFQGGESRDFLQTLKARFKDARIAKPSASRSESREMFFVGLGFKR